MCEIIFEDGTKITNLKVNGTNFISEEPISENDFKGKLNNVIINIDGVEHFHEHMYVGYINHFDDGYYIFLVDYTKEQLKEMKTQSDIEYIAMMTGVDL